VQARPTKMRALREITVTLSLRREPQLALTVSHIASVTTLTELAAQCELTSPNILA
jgi:hypothetical protein